MTVFGTWGNQRKLRTAETRTFRAKTGEQFAIHATY